MKQIIFVVYDDFENSASSAKVGSALKYVEFKM